MEHYEKIIANAVSLPAVRQHSCCFIERKFEEKAKVKVDMVRKDMMVLGTSQKS